MLRRHGIIHQLQAAKDEQWIYRVGDHVRRANIGSAIRNSIVPAPFHYIQLFFSPRFWGMLTLRDMLSIFDVWSVLVMSIGIDPFMENQPMQGHTFGGALKKWGPALRSLFFGLTRNGLSTDPDQVPLAGFLGFLRFYTVMRRDAWAFEYLPNGRGEVCEKLSAKIQSLGGEIRFRSRVKRALSPDALAGRHPAFEDARLDELLFRYRARNFPQTLADVERERWAGHCSERLHHGAGGALTLAAYQGQIDKLAETADERKQAILEQLVDYAEQIAPPLD